MTDYSQLPIPDLIREWGYASTAVRYHLEAIDRGQQRHVLDVPYFSQWDIPEADRSPGDCGPAAVNCLVYYLRTYTPTVDEVAIQCGQPPGGRYTSTLQLKTGAARYGLTLERQQLLVDDLIRELIAGVPSIALIHYGTLRALTDTQPEWIVKNQDRNFNGYHWVAVVGWIPERTEVVVNDSNFLGDRRSDGDHRRVPVGAFAPAMRDASNICLVIR